MGASGSDDTHTSENTLQYGEIRVGKQIYIYTVRYSLLDFFSSLMFCTMADVTTPAHKVAEMHL